PQERAKLARPAVHVPPFFFVRPFLTEVGPGIIGDGPERQGVRAIRGLHILATTGAGEGLRPEGRRLRSAAGTSPPRDPKRSGGCSAPASPGGPTNYQSSARAARSPSHGFPSSPGPLPTAAPA